MLSTNFFIQFSFSAPVVSRCLISPSQQGHFVTSPFLRKVSTRLSFPITQLRLWMATVSLPCHQTTGSCSARYTIHYIYTQCMHRFYLHSEWRSHNITPILKTKDKSFVKNYHPISLLCYPLKVLEKLILNKILRSVWFHEESVDC